MAGSARGPSSNLKLDLLEKGHAFSFFQVMRLLPFFDGPNARIKAAQSGKTGNVRIRPKLSLAFPPSDVDSIEEFGEGEPRFLVTATFLGLYGPSSPLPTFYTEDLIDEASEDESVSKDFIDVINHRLFSLLFRCWVKYRQLVQVVEERNPQHLQRLFSLLGLGEKTLRRVVPDAYRLIRYIGLLTQFPRSAVGLKVLLQDALGDVCVQVISCVQRKAKIPRDQRLFLGSSGHCLGQDSYLGEEIEDRMGKFRLRIGPLNSRQFQGLLPGRGECEKLAFLTRFYVTDPLEYDAELVLAEGKTQCACLGAPEWSRLGLDTWSFSTEALGEVSARFYPDQ